MLTMRPEAKALCEPPLTIEKFIACFGSKRRLYLAYWTDGLSESGERFIEDHVPPEILIGYRPIVQ